MQRININNDNFCNKDSSSSKSLHYWFYCDIDHNKRGDMTLDVNLLLQAESIDIFDRIHIIKSLTSSVRNDIDSYHSKWYGKALVLVNSLSIEESKSKTSLRQVYCSNMSSSNSSEYFKQFVTIPVIDYIQSEPE